MRTQFLFVGLLSGVAGLLVGAGCDNITAGQPSDSSAPPQLQHVMVQDARYVLAFPNRASALDILDNNPTRTCTIECKGNCPTDPVSKMAPPQEDTCINEFLVDQVAPDVHCLDSGVCNDPIKIPASGVPVPGPLALIGLKPDMRDPGGGVQIRLIFDKVLDNSIEMVTPNGSTTPGATLTYMMKPGIIEFDDPSGKEFAGGVEYYYDNGGSFQYSADLELVPLGPAIVIKPKAPLDAHTKYTVVIKNPGALKDREGNQAVALGGGALGTSYSFTTEDLTPNNAGAFPSDAAGGNGLDFPNFTSGMAQIAPNDVIQIGFFEAFAGDSATVTVKSGCTGAKPIAYSERGNDPTMCTKADPGGYPVLDIVNTDTGSVKTGVPADWPMGDCTLSISVPDINMRGAPFTEDITFTVTGMDQTDPMMDPNIASQHVTPAQCMM